ncbi:poly [ADP-ribose] polymerase tankyrase-like [Cloeon dipterum]|uniref:poly [ADP-ribose] polymerase tankyrase-like n=1 Tax=Cloeon dipterum TaxID=197152 RepID=UPI00322084CD
MATLETLDSSNALYKQIVQRMRETIKDHANDIPLSDYQIVKIQKISNSAANNRRFEAKRTEIERAYSGSQVWETFHGSPQCDKIVAEGFDVRCSKPSSMFGRGIYVAPHSSKANQYAFGKNKGCSSHNNTACTICVRKMLVCYCIMGRQFHPNAPTKDIPSGYNSVVADPDTNPQIRQHLKFPEYCILRGEQVLPYILIEYRILTHDRLPRPRIVPMRERREQEVDDATQIAERFLLLVIPAAFLLRRLLE